MSESQEKLDQLQSKIDEARSHTGTGHKGLKPASDSLGPSMRMAVELLAGMIVGAVGGFYADKALHCSPLFMIVGLFLGVAAGFRNIIRESNTIDDDH